MKKTKLLFTSFLALIIGLSLSACSTQKEKTSLPSAKTILAGAQDTTLKNLAANWQQTDANNKTTQSAKIKYSSKPLVMHADITTNSNHYKMWIDNKTNYIQMRGTASDKWFKTKFTDSSSYAQLADSIAKNALLNLDDSTAKQFKVKKASSGYKLTYNGNSAKIWNSIKQSSSITSMIGIDFSKAKLTNINIEINTDKNYKLTGLNVLAKYKENKKNKTFKMTISQINKLGKLKVPTSVSKNAINLEKIK